MYFEFDDVRRIHQPYTDGYFRGKSAKIIHPDGQYSLSKSFLSFVQLPFGRLQPITRHISIGREVCTPCLPVFSL